MLSDFAPLNQTYVYAHAHTMHPSLLMRFAQAGAYNPPQPAHTDCPSKLERIRNTYLIKDAQHFIIRSYSSCMVVPDA
jgi:hypothetical protein